jgi:hypothetical protein
MLGREITLNKLIAAANSKVASDKETLEKMAVETGLKGTVEEVMDYVETHQALFSDSNLAEVKTALSNFLRKMPSSALRLTMAAIRRELEEFKNQQNPSGANGGQILTQSDLDALLSQIKTDSDKSPEADESFGEHDSLRPEPSLDSRLETMDQSDIDALLASVHVDPDASSPQTEAPEQGGPECDAPGSDQLFSREDPASRPTVYDKESTSISDQIQENLSEFIPDASSQFSKGECQKQVLKTAEGILTPDHYCVVLQEKGDARILKEFYRIYVQDNGMPVSFFETDSKEMAKAEFERALAIYPANRVFLGKIVQKEVLVVKEDIRKVPVALHVDFTE